MKQTIRIPGRPRCVKKPHFVGVTFEHAFVESLRRMAAAEGVSMASLIRGLVMKALGLECVRK